MNNPLLRILKSGKAESDSKEGGPGSGRYPAGSGSEDHGVTQEPNGQIKLKTPKNVDQAISQLKKVETLFDAAKKNYDSLPSGHPEKVMAGLKMDHANKQLGRAISNGKKFLKAKKESEGVVTPDDNQGINVKHWFYGAMERLAPKGKRESHLQYEEPTGTLNTSPSPQTPEEIIAQNPEIGASTLLNLLKSKGYEIKAPVTEADSSSTLVAQTRESSVDSEPGRKHLSFRTRLVEASYKDDGIGPTKFRVILLKEGMGNSRDAYYYSRDAIISAVTVFEGRKIYSDHPSLAEEETRPERSVRDILGYFESVGAEEQPDGCMALVGDAAHPMLPYLAQGAGMAIEDAAELALQLNQATAADVPQRLQQFAQARWQRNARVQMRAVRNGEIFHARGPLRWGRDAGLRVMGSTLMDVPWLYSARF